MNNYITLDGKQYKTLHNNWKPIVIKPMTIRPTQLKQIDVTYGPGTMLGWEGTLEALPTGDSTWGDYSDIRASIAKREGVSFTDHFGNSGIVHIGGDMPYNSLSPKWDGTSNRLYFAVRLILEEMQ